MKVLYQYPGGDGLTSVSPPCVKVEMALRLLDAPYRVEYLTSPRQVQRVSVTGTLPVLELDGERIADSITILDRLEQDHPDSRLWPADPVERVRDRLWDHYATDSLYWLGFYMRWVRRDTSTLFLEGVLRRAPWLLRRLAPVLVVPRRRKRAMLHGVGGKPADQVSREIDRGFDTVLTGLAGGPYLQGRDHPGRGDLSCVALLVQAGFRGNMPETMEQILGRPELPPFCARTLRACSMDVPGWLVRKDAADHGQT